MQGGNVSAAFLGSQLQGADQFSYMDIRYDEDYDKFYKAVAGTPGLKLPPPLDSRTLYSDLPHFNQPHIDPLQPVGPLDLDTASPYGERLFSAAVLISHCPPPTSLGYKASLKGREKGGGGGGGGCADKGVYLGTQ